MSDSGGGQNDTNAINSGVNEPINIDNDNTEDGPKTISGQHAHEVIIVDVHPNGTVLDFCNSDDSASSRNRNINKHGSSNKIQNNVVMHLQAYKQGLAVAHMAWSKSGNMLATAPQDARTVSVYGIFPGICKAGRRQTVRPQLCSSNATSKCDVSQPRSW